MKKWISLLLTTVMSLCLLTSCGSSGDTVTDGKNQSDASATSGQSGEITKLTMYMITTGNEPKDKDMVEEAINEIAREKIDAEVDINYLSAQNYANQMNLMLSSGEKLDIIFEGSMTNNVSVALNGALLPLNDLLENYGQGIIETLGEDYVNENNIDGNIYFIACNKERAKGPVIITRKDILDEIGVDPDDVTTIEEYGDVLRKVKEKYPDMIPMYIGSNALLDMMVINQGDKLTDYMGVLMNCYDGSYEVVNPFATQEYKDAVNLIHSWYEEGLIAEDILTIQMSEIGTYYQSGRLFSNTNAQKPDQVKIQSSNYGYEMAGIKMDDWPARIDSEVMLAAGYAIPYNCENPEKAMEFLNLMYTDADIANLLNWGIEGTHYVVNDDGTASFANGLDSSTSGYYYNLGWAIGNQFIAHPWEGNDADIWEQYQTFNSEAKTSDACGFVFDSTKVKNEYAAVSNVLSEYQYALESGVSDPEIVLPEFLEKLEAAGIDMIIAEKQSQLDEWRAQ